MEDVVCKRCGTVNEFFTEEAGVHVKAICNHCKIWIKNLPQSDGNNKRPGKHTDLVKKYSKGYCELCLRTKESLPRKQTLEAHHVIPYKCGGEAEESNVWIVCTCCHRQIEHYRTYLGHYGGQKFIGD